MPWLGTRVLVVLDTQELTVKQVRNTRNRPRNLTSGDVTKCYVKGRIGNIDFFFFNVLSSLFSCFNFILVVLPSFFPLFLPFFLHPYFIYLQLLPFFLPSFVGSLFTSLPTYLPSFSPVYSFSVES